MVLACFASASVSACGPGDRPHLLVSVPNRSVSKLPFIVAMDQGLYAKHGVAVELWTPPAGTLDRATVSADLWTSLQRRVGIGLPKDYEVTVDGASPGIVEMMQSVEADGRIAIASTDCVVRAHVVARPGLARLEDLKGGRIGVSSLRATSGFHALVLARRMGWDPVDDMTIMADADGISAVTRGEVDAIIAYEDGYAAAKRAGLPILADMREWNESVAGNSVRVHREWLTAPGRRDAAMRFLRASTEAIAVMYRRPEVAFDVMARWYGITDPAYAKDYLSRGAWIPRAPFPCADGTSQTMALYDSREMRRHSATDFYDDSLVQELVASGFVDDLYR
jgi:ABC-type nitrate/sulfonate/bicarbonate transport system substrate-binding protein